MNNLACRIFREQIDLLLSLPNQEEAKTVLYQAVVSSYIQTVNQFDNQFDNQNKNQFDCAYVSDSVSLSILSKNILSLLSKNIIWKEFSNNYGGRRENAGRKVKNNQNENQVENQIEKQNEKRFVKPTIDEIKEYCGERKNKINADDFFDFYESKGWKIGKSPMKDWRASVRTWERKDVNNHVHDADRYANSKIPAEVYIDSGQFYLDNTFAEFSDMTDEQCNSCAKWLLDKFRFQTLPREKFVKIARGFKK